MKISTHAPRTGSDGTCCLSAILLQHDFNPRSPHGERPGMMTTNTSCKPYFNPRSPHGERHSAIGSVSIHAQFQPTLPARGATVHALAQRHRLNISTHAPRTGSDDISSILISHRVNFNPRSPHGERPSKSSRAMRPENFNPRSPHGERRFALSKNSTSCAFQPTLPARGATRKVDV